MILGAILSTLGIFMVGYLIGCAVTDREWHKELDRMDARSKT